MLIATEGGATISVGKELLEREDVIFAARTIGEHTIDLRVETLIKDNGQSARSSRGSQSHEGSQRRSLE